jgi:hypothetical protein
VGKIGVSGREHARARKRERTRKRVVTRPKRQRLESMAPIRVSKSFPARYSSGERLPRALHKSKRAPHSMTDPRAIEKNRRL